VNKVITCVHAERGLCPRCLRDWRDSPGGYVLYGEHPRGIERREALMALLLEAGVVSAEPPEEGEP